jgi:hypothetical protein
LVGGGIDARAPFKPEFANFRIISRKQRFVQELVIRETAKQLR